VEGVERHECRESRDGLGTALHGVLLEQRLSKRPRSQAQGLIQGKDLLANFGHSEIAFIGECGNKQIPHHTQEKIIIIAEKT